MFFHVKLATLAFVSFSLFSGAAVAPQGAGAFVLGLWAGVLIAGPPLMLLAFCLGLCNLRQLLSPLLRLPVLIALTVGVLYLSGAELGLGLQATLAGAVLWWARKGRLLLGL